MKRIIDLKQGSGGTNGHKLGYKLASIVGKENMDRFWERPWSGTGMSFIINTPMNDDEILKAWPYHPEPIIQPLH